MTVADESVDERISHLFERIKSLELRRGGNVYLNGSKLESGDTIILASMQQLTEIQYHDIVNKVESIVSNIKVVLVHGVAMTVIKNDSNT